VLALFIRHANCIFSLRIAVSSSVAYLAVAIFFKLTHKRHDFGKEYLKIKFVVIFSTNLSKIFLILRIIQQGIIINVHKSSCKVAVILV